MKRIKREIVGHRKIGKEGPVEKQQTHFSDEFTDEINLFIICVLPYTNAC